MIRANTSADVCDYPVVMDTYYGCSHACKYCFVKRQHSINNIKPVSQAMALRNFINHKRNRLTKAFAWDIPVKIGTVCDPLQPCEREYQETLKCFEVFAETGYPFIINTKNPGMLNEEPYRSLIEKCNCVINVTMACSRYDALEQGAPAYEERLKAVAELSPRVKRVNALASPLFPDALKEILPEFARMSKAGIYGVTTCGFYSPKKHPGMVKDGIDYLFPLDRLVPLYKKMREECHRNGMRFFCEDSRARFLADSLTCCGTEFLDGFKPSTANLPHMAYGDDFEIVPSMKEKGSGYLFFNATGHSMEDYFKYKEITYEDKLAEIAQGYVSYWCSLRDKYE